MSIEPYVLPNSLEQQIRAFMKKMGLVFGSLDFIVSEDHEYIFLEVNEQGQFLWIEDANPDIKMLDIFVNFLLSNSRTFKWKQKNIVHSIAKYEKKMMSMVEQNKRNHVNLNAVQAYGS